MSLRLLANRHLNHIVLYLVLKLFQSIFLSGNIALLSYDAIFTWQKEPNPYLNSLVFSSPRNPHQFYCVQNQREGVLYRWCFISVYRVSHQLLRHQRHFPPRYLWHCHR